MSVMTIRIPPALAKSIQQTSKRRKVSKSDIAREAIERYIKVLEFEDMRALLVPKAQALGIFTDEDVFRALGEDFE